MPEYAGKHRAEEHELIDQVGWVEFLTMGGEHHFDQEDYEAIVEVAHLN